MAEDDKELLAEIARLREDVRQLREIVNVLVNVVMEEDVEEEETHVLDQVKKCMVGISEDENVDRIDKG